MHEQSKINEAEYFYSQTLKHREKRNEFKYNLSAFLSAARSVLQYILKEAQTKPGGQNWYDTTVISDRILSFFKEKRDINIHEEPVEPNRNITAELKETVRVTESIITILRDAEGNIKEKETVSSKQHKDEEDEKLKARTRITYKFDDWSGNEDVVTLCREYLYKLKNIVKDGQNKGFFS